MVKLLVVSGADIYVKDSRGRTAYMLADQAGPFPEIKKFLDRVVQLQDPSKVDLTRRTDDMRAMLFGGKDAELVNAPGTEGAFKVVDEEAEKRM